MPEIHVAKNVIQKQIQRAAFPLMFALLVVYCVVGAAVIVRGSCQLLRSPWENSYFESPQTYAAIYAVQTGKLYIPMSQPPYTPQAYAPLYYAFNATIAWASHLDMDVFIYYSRLSTFIAFLLCGGMVFLICQSARIPTVHAVLAALMALGHPELFGWNISPRPDMLLLLLMLISLYCAVRWEEHPWHGYGLAGVFAGLAFLIKQPGAAVAVAIFAVLVIRREYKKAAILTLGALVPVAITLCILYWRRDPFLAQTTFIGKSLWSVSNAAAFLYANCLGAHWIVPLCIGTLGFIRARSLDSKSQMIASFGLVNWIVGLAGMPQLGGYMNYLFPGLVSCALLLPYAIQLIQTFPRQTVSMAVASVALIWATSSAYTLSNSLITYFHPPEGTSLAWLRPFRVLSDLTTLNLHGRDPNLLDPFGAHVLELTGHWDSSPIVENLKRGDYDLIILTRTNYLHTVASFRGVSYFSPDEVRIINERYEVLCSTLSSMVFRPRGRDVPVTPEMVGSLFNKRCGIGYRRFPMDLKLAPNTR